jgi:hypothetical protein
VEQESCLQPGLSRRLSGDTYGILTSFAAALQMSSVTKTKCWCLTTCSASVHGLSLCETLWVDSKVLFGTYRNDPGSTSTLRCGAAALQHLKSIARKWVGLLLEVQPASCVG